MQPLFRYEEIAADLREQIREGRFAHGKRLPAERVMMEGYGVQRNTIRQALMLLQKEGWLHVRARSGAFAVSNPTASAASTANGADTAKTTRNAPLLPLLSEGTVLVINAWNHSSTALDRILIGLSHALEDTSYTLHRFNSQPRTKTGLHVLPSAEYLQANQVVGAILWAQNPTELEALIELRSEVPLILMDRRVVGFETDCIRFDDKAGGYLITQHLIARGHRRIGFLGDETFAETVQQRWHGYSLALEEAGIVPDPTPFALFEGGREPLFTEYMRIFLAGAGDPLTAVVCSNDITALTLLRYLRREGIRVPEDVAVTGYGNLLSDYMDTLDLTTMEQPFEEAGRSAGQLLRQRCASAYSPTTGGYRQVVLPVHLIARNSSNAPPKSERSESAKAHRL